MSAPVRPYIFSQVGLDSGALTMLGAVVHRFTDPGEYRGVATQQGGVRSIFLLTVDESRTAVQVDIDLATLAESTSVRPCPCGSDHGRVHHFFVGTKAHGVFYVSGGPGGFSVSLARAEDGPQPKVFDSARLDSGDIFAATLLRPGVYSAVNALAGSAVGHASIEVAYPQVGKADETPPAPVRLECGPGGFQPSSVHLSAAQGCVFTCTGASRILIALETPHEPPR